MYLILKVRTQGLQQFFKRGVNNGKTYIFDINLIKSVKSLLVKTVTPILGDSAKTGVDFQIKFSGKYFDPMFCTS